LGTPLKSFAMTLSPLRLCRASNGGATLRSMIYLSQIAILSWW